MLVRTNHHNEAFQKLVNQLDTELAITDGEDHDFYHQFNVIKKLNYVILFMVEDQAVACGAIKKYDNSSMEIKRMYTLPNYRGRGIAYKILDELESWAKELEYQNCILETGKRQYSAIKLYEKAGYQLTDNYAQYIGMENSLCFKKTI